LSSASSAREQAVRRARPSLASAEGALRLQLLLDLGTAAAMPGTADERPFAVKSAQHAV
jgi:hypothetical protein